MSKKKPTLVANMTNEKPPEGLVDGVDKACTLILECMDFNNISKSEAVSSMATMIVSILAHYESPTHFYQVLKMMDQGFKESRKLPK